MAMTERTHGKRLPTPLAMAGTSSSVARPIAASVSEEAADPVAQTPTHAWSASSPAIVASRVAAVAAALPWWGSRRLQSSSGAADGSPAATATTLTELAPASMPTV